MDLMSQIGDQNPKKEKSLKLRGEKVKDLNNFVVFGAKLKEGQRLSFIGTKASDLHSKKAMWDKLINKSPP